MACHMQNENYSLSDEGAIESNVVMSRELQDILMRHWLFGVLPGRTIADLSHQFATKRYKKDQFIFHQEDKADRLYVILDGEISIESYQSDGQMTKITHLHGGEIFGEFALIDEMGRSASARIVKPSTLASLKGSVFDKLLTEHPGFSRKMLHVLVGRVRATNEQVSSLVTMNLLQRTARLLLQLQGLQGNDIKITQTELSERLFASREKVNVKLKELEQLGAIETGHGQIRIRNTEALKILL